jgi:hypothetical protein
MTQRDIHHTEEFSVTMCIFCGCEDRAFVPFAMCGKHGGGTRCPIKDCANFGKGHGACTLHQQKCSAYSCIKNCTPGSRLCDVHLLADGDLCHETACRRRAVENGGLCREHQSRKQRRQSNVSRPIGNRRVKSSRLYTTQLLPRLFIPREFHLKLVFDMIYM